MGVRCLFEMGSGVACNHTNTSDMELAIAAS